MEYFDQRISDMMESLKLSVNSTIRQDVVGYWAEIASLKSKIKELEAKIRLLEVK